MAKKKADTNKAKRLIEERNHTIAAILRFISWELSNPHAFTEGLDPAHLPPSSRGADLQERLSSGGVDGLALTTLLKHAAHGYEGIPEGQLKAELELQRRRAKEKLRQMQKSPGAMSKVLKGGRMPPITRLRNPSTEGPAILTHPMAIDELMRQTMGATFTSNAYTTTLLLEDCASPTTTHAASHKDAPTA